MNRPDADLEREHRELVNVLAALDMAGDGIAIIGDDDRIAYANKSMVDTFGLAGLDQLLGRRSEEIVIGDAPILDPTTLAEAREAVRRDGRWNGEIALRRGGTAGRGGLARLLVHLRELPQGGRVAVITDVTEARRRDEERQRLEQQLEQARRLEALGQLAAGVAHDFNNLLGAILGFAQFIADDTGADSPLHRYASRIITAGQQAKSLIGQIMSFSSRRGARVERIEMDALLDENMTILRAIVPASTALTIKVAEEGTAITGQRSQITQVLVNLALNASEALRGRDGAVTIELEPVDSADSTVRRLRGLCPDPDSTQSLVETWTDEAGLHHAGTGALRSEDDYLRLSVSDTGDGMPPEVVARVFDPFFTTKGKAGGTGLGLTVVHGVVVAHHGGVMVTTAPGRGCRFDILLPLAAEAGAAEPESQAVAPVAHRGSILLVDDSSHFGDMLMTALFRLGYEISVCDDPRDAIGYVEEDPEAWDMVISDQAMVHMDGTEFIAMVKALRPDLPCIICTALPGEPTEEAARQAGADGFATKPLDLGRFSLMVKELMERG